ncbi:hypothetical protein N7501_011576, partial [Penicillium viridicatum]
TKLTIEPFDTINTDFLRPSNLLPILYSLTRVGPDRRKYIKNRLSSGYKPTIGRKSIPILYYLAERAIIEEYLLQFLTLNRLPFYLIEYLIFYKLFRLARSILSLP